MIKYFTLLVIIFSSWGCEKKPHACIDLDEVIEAGDAQTLLSCSEDFEFLTWEYSDGVGTVGNVSQRFFQKEKSMSVRVTAYSDGAYRSDYAEQTFEVSYRYVDYFEITGNSAYDSMHVELGNNLRWSTLESEGSFTEEDPLVISSWPQRSDIIEAISQSIVLYGFSGTTRLPLASKKFNFSDVKDNPTVVESENGRFEVKMYWTFREI